MHTAVVVVVVHIVVVVHNSVFVVVVVVIVEGGECFGRKRCHLIPKNNICKENNFFFKKKSLSDSLNDVLLYV